MNHQINSLIGGPSAAGHGNGLNTTAASTPGTGPGPGPGGGGGGGGANAQGNSGIGILQLQQQQMFGSFDANMASSVTLACCQSLCDVLTELPLPTAVQDESSHTRSLITGLNVNLTTAKNTLLNDLTMVPQIQQALFMAKQQLSDTTFHSNHLHHNSSTSPASSSSNITNQSPSTDPQSVGGSGPSPSHNHQPSQLLHELITRGCFLNSQLSSTAAAAVSTPSSKSSSSSVTATPAASLPGTSIYQSSTPSSSSSVTPVSNTATGTAASNATPSNNDSSIVNDLHSIEPSIRHIPDLHQNLMNDLINDECCDPTISTTTTTTSTTSTNPSSANDLYSHQHHAQQQQNHNQQEHSTVLTGSQHGHQMMTNNTNDYPQMNHQQQQYQHQQQQITNIHNQDVNNSIKIEPDHQQTIQQQQYHQQQQPQQLSNQNFSSLGERVKNRQREAAAKAIQANAATFGTNNQPYYNQQQQQQLPNNDSQAMSINNNSMTDQIYNNDNNNNNANNSNQILPPTPTSTRSLQAVLNNIKNEHGQQSSTDDKDWQPQTSSSTLQRKSSISSSTSSTVTTPTYNRKPLYQQPPVRPKVEMVKPQIRSVKYEFTDIDNDSAFLSKSVDIVIRFEQIIDQILQTSCNDFNNYYDDIDVDNMNTMNNYNDYNDNDYYNSNYVNNNNNQYHNKYHHTNQQHQHNKHRNTNNVNNKRIKTDYNDTSDTNHVNGMSFNVSIDSDQLKEIMILTAKLKQTNRIGEIERKKLILFLTVLSNQLNIWLTRYKSKSSIAAASYLNDPFNQDDDQDHSDNENERQHYWELCCNASQSALHLMTSTSNTKSSSSSSISDQLISLEELIEVIVDFLSNNLSAATHVSTTSTPSKSKSKSSSSSSYNQYQHFGVSKRHVTRWTQLLQLLFEFINLRTKGSLTDTLILSLTRISMSALFLLQNTAEMQFVSIEILCHVFEEYQKHRISILEELLNSLSKIPTKKSHRKDSVLTQMLIRLTNAFFQPNTNQTHTRDSLSKQSTAALQIISSFLSHFLRKCHQHSSGGANSDTDFKLIFESLLNDLLEQIHSPHQTASILIVQVIIKILISYLSPQQQQNKAQTSSLAARLLAIEYLSIVCSKFAQFLAEKDETIKELSTTFSTIEQELDVKKPLKKTKNRDKQQQQQQQEESIQKQKDNENFVTKVYSYLIDYFNSEKLYREKLCLASIWIKDKYFTENEKNEQNFLQKLNQSKFNDDNDNSSVVAISTAALCIQYMEFVHFSTNTRLFDISISHVTASLSNTSNTAQRSRAMKCLSNILSSSTIDRATQLLSRTDLQNAMRSALLDPSTSVREATVDLIGRFVLQSKDQNLVQRYSDLIGDRILDTGISVRKRVIKILRDFCIEFPEYEKCGEMAVKIVRRINDDGEGIRKLVVDTCRDLWFTSGTQVTKYKVYSLLHVIANMINDNASMESMQSLFDQLIKSDTMPIAQQICDSIMNDVLIDDMPNSSKKTQLSAVQCVAMITQCCPELMVKHCDTLQSLMSLPCETLIEISLRMKVIQTIERVLPHIHNPSPYLLTRIEEDLTKNILQSSANIIQYAVKCLSVLIKNHTKNTKLAVELFCKFQQILYQYRNLLYEGHNEPLVKPKLLRAIFTCGLFAKYFLTHIYDYKDRVRDTFIELILSPYDVDIKCKAIVALGFIIESDPKICLLPNVIEIYTRILRNEYSENVNIHSITRKNDELFCIQVLNNFRNYLSESIESDENAVKTIEWSRESLKSMQSSEDDSGSTQSQIIQKYLNSILINALNPNLSIRRVACNVIHVIHSGGHVHPLQLVPHLVAMTCDDDYQIRVRADHVLHDIERKYHGYVAMKAKEAVQLSALFCKKLNCSGFRIIMEKSSSSSSSSSSNATQDGQTLISMPSQSKEICSRLSTLYQVICTNRQSRRGFIASLLRHFDTSEFVVKSATTNSTDSMNQSSSSIDDTSSSLSMTTTATTSTNKSDMIDIEFFVESILFFPYTVFDEILYILNQLECTSSINSTHVTQLFKEIFIVEKLSSSSSSATNAEDQSMNQQQQPQIIYDEMGNAQMVYPSNQMMMNQQPQQQQQSNIDIEDIDLENEDQLKKYENNIHVNFDLLLSDRNNERLTNLIRSLRTIYLSTLLRTLLKEFYLLKDEKINDYSTNDAKTWEKPVHRRQIESIHLKELFNLAKPNIDIQESLLLQNDLQNVEKQLLNEWKRFRQVSLNNNDPNFKSTLLTKLFQFGSSKSSSNANQLQQQQNRNIVDEQSNNEQLSMTNCINDANNGQQSNIETPQQQQQPPQQTTPNNRRQQSNNRMTNSNKKSKPVKKKRKRIVFDGDSDESPSEDDDDDDEDYQQGF